MCAVKEVLAISKHECSWPHETATTRRDGSSWPLGLVLLPSVAVRGGSERDQDVVKQDDVEDSEEQDVAEAAEKTKAKKQKENAKKKAQKKRKREAEIEKNDDD